jgi:predicted neutral ceramidase superfamily lipid hydrolase
MKSLDPSMYLKSMIIYYVLFFSVKKLHACRVINYLLILELVIGEGGDSVVVVVEVRYWARGLEDLPRSCLVGRLPDWPRIQGR